MSTWSRRQFVQTSVSGLVGAALGATARTQSKDQKIPRGERPSQARGVEVLNPLEQVPLSFIIDDSTCLVNLAYFGIPQFAEVFPQRYQQNWQRLPREIPDTFVREFGEWCRDHGVKGKYSIVPYPACVGWVDRFLPGWSRKDLDRSLALVREFMMPNWDIHPEMISHTRVINLQTGRPYPKPDPAFMENWGWSQDKSADELAAYMAHGLQVLKNAGLYCEGVTTPGGFGSENKKNLALGTLQAVRSVFGAQVPHYFRDLYTDSGESVAPQVYYASGLQSGQPKCVVSVVGCTGDWFGGWDGLSPGSVDRFITKDLQKGRLVDVIEHGEPAVMVCHWPGIYYNGQRTGFKIFQKVVRRLEATNYRTRWMKLSDISRYWAAKELTRIDTTGTGVTLHAPFAASCFTLAMKADAAANLHLIHKNQRRSLARVKNTKALKPGSWYQTGGKAVVCFELSQGVNHLKWSA